MPGRTNILEKYAIEMLRHEDPYIQHNGMHRECRSILADEPEVLETILECKRKPDAWKIDRAERILHLYEVENYNPLSPDKLADYAILWFYLDCDEWDVKLTVVDRYGQNPREIDLFTYWFVKQKANNS